MPEYLIKTHSDIDKFLKWSDDMISRALKAGPVLATLGREKRNLDQNAKGWAMFTDFEPIEFNGRKWGKEAWRCFLMSAFNGEMPAVGLLGEPVSVSLSTSKMSKKRYAEFIEFVYATGADRGVEWSDPAMKYYDEVMREHD